MEDRTTTAQSHQGKATSLVKRLAWVDAVMADPDLEASEKCLAYALARHQNDDRLQCNPSSQRLAEELGRNERSVRGSIGRLELSGWINTRGPKGRSLQFDLVSAEARLPRASTPAPTPGADARTHPGRRRPTPPGVHARTPRAYTPDEPVNYQSLNQQEKPAKELNQPQANEVREGGVEEVEVIEHFPGGEAEAVDVDGATVSFGDDVASLDGDSSAVRHDTLSGEREPPRGAVPDLAEGDQGEAEEVGDDEPFPGGDVVAYVGWERFPSALPEDEGVEEAPVVKPERMKTVLHITVEELGANPEGFERAARAERGKSGVCFYTIMQQHAEELSKLTKDKRYDRFEELVKQAKKANDNDDRAREAG